MLDNYLSRLRGTFLSLFRIGAALWKVTGAIISARNAGDTAYIRIDSSGIGFHGSTSGTTVLTVPTEAGNVTFTLPALAGTAGQLMKNAGGGVMVWGEETSYTDGAISTVLHTDLDTNKALISSGTGKIAVSATTSTELGYIAGLTSSAQTQLSTKIDTLSTEAEAFLQKSGTTLDLDTQSANRVLAGPTSGGAAKPTFRVLGASDLPSAGVGSAGIIPVASQSTVDTGTDNTSAVTAATLFAHAWPTVSITGGTTLTSSAFSKIHICTGTTEDYTVVLPAVSGNAGRWIAFVMSNALTKLVTLDGNGSETINGALTRVMWTNEWALLYCNGAMWYKQAGLSIPMRARISCSAAQTINHASYTLVVLDTPDFDYGSLADTSATNYKITTRRAGTCLLSAGNQFVDGFVYHRALTDIVLNGTTILQRAEDDGDGVTYPGQAIGTKMELAAGSAITLKCFQTNVGAGNASVVGNPPRHLELMESLTW